MTIANRIIILILITLSISGLANLLLTRHQSAILHADSEKILAHTVVQSLREAVVQDVINNNKLRVSDLLRSLIRHDNPIEFLYVTRGVNHEVFAHSFTEGFPAFLVSDHDSKIEREGIFLSHKYETVNGLIFIYDENLLPGLDTVLHIGINQTEIQQQLAKNNQTILITSIIIALIALFIALLLSRQLSTPLTRFVAQIQRYGSGQGLALTGLHNAPAEIAQLAKVFQTATSDREKTLERLAEREQHLALTLDSIGDAVITTDSDGQITRMNPIAEQLTGWGDIEANGRILTEVFNIINGITREAAENPLKKVLLSGQIIGLANHTVLIRKDGREFQIADSGAPIKDERGDILGVILVFRDVSEEYEMQEQLRQHRDHLEHLVAERTSELQAQKNTLEDNIKQLKQAQKQLVESEKMVSLGSLVAGVAHEINTPVGVSLTGITHIHDEIKQINKQLHNEELTQSALEKFLERSEKMSDAMHHSLRQASELIRSFKQVAVDQHGEDKREFDLHQYIDDVILSLHHKIKHTRITVINDCNRDCLITSYPGIFSQIITNLITNSLVHGFKPDDEGEIIIQAQRQDKQLILSYADNGNGIEASILPRVFDPFFTTKLGQGGSGLGLNIIYNLVSQKLNGHIRCDSQPGNGVKFTLEIPL